MTPFFSTIYGSRLFGCAIPSSDLDTKQVHMEWLQDLLFKDTHAVQEKAEDSTYGKTESESFSLRFYLKMLMQGQVIATDMFFAPSEFWLQSGPLWNEIHQLKPYVITRNIKPFAGYARSQALKYGNKGTKLKTVQKAIQLLEDGLEFKEVAHSLAGMEGVKLYTEHAAGGPIRHICICGKDFGETTDYKLWLEPLRMVEESYGERARLSTTGLDVKAQYHTVRICSEAIELLSTGQITFPRPEAPLLLKIRSGEMPEAALRELVDIRIAELESCSVTSELPDAPNLEKVNDFIYHAQREFLKGSLL